MSLCPPLIGHHATQTQLAKLLESGRFPHAILLHGPQGVGKRLLAQHLALRLICGPAQAASTEVDMFGTPTEAAPEQGPLAFNTSSPQYAQIQAESCPDYHILAPLDGKKSIGIKQVQELLETLLRTADTARTVIVDSLEDLTPEAANTLLKTLEEPRPGIFFLLIAHQLSATLPTIRSRCRLIPLQPLSLAETQLVLQSLKEDPTLAAVASGAPGSVLGAGAKARATALLALQAGQAPNLTTPGFVGLLMQHLAQQQPGLAQAEAYFKLATLQRDAADKNLPTHLIAQTAHTIYESTTQSQNTKHENTKH